MDVKIGGPTAREANPEMFDFVDRLIAVFEEHHDTAFDPEDATHIVLLKIVDRAHNLAKAIIVLCEHRWWEFADGLARQLYELLLNLEELHRADDREAAAKRWLRFGALQYMQGSRHRRSTTPIRGACHLTAPRRSPSSGQAYRACSPSWSGTARRARLAFPKTTT